MPPLIDRPTFANQLNILTKWTECLAELEIEPLALSIDHDGPAVHLSFGDMIRWRGTLPDEPAHLATLRKDAANGSVHFRIDLGEVVFTAVRLRGSSIVVDAQHAS